MDKPLLSPYIRREDSYAGMCRDVLFCVAALCVFSYVYFGVRPLLLTLCSMASAVIAETLCCVLMRRPLTVLDGSALVTGALCGMLLSPIAPFYVAILAAVFAVMVAKMPFGGLGRNVFNPTAAGVALVTLLFSAEMFTYPDMDATVPLGWVTADVLTEQSPAALLRVGGSTSYQWSELLFGQFPGPIGATPMLILLGCGAYLCIRRTASPLVTLSCLGTCALLAALFPRMEGMWYQSVLLELSSGYLLFGSLFLLNDPVTSPGHWLGRLGYGILIGFLTMLFRHMGRFEEGMCFAVLIGNAVQQVLDKGGWRLCRAIGRRIRRETP